MDDIPALNAGFRTLWAQLILPDISTALLGTVILCPVLTWALSRAAAQPVMPGDGREPPVASYWLPWFQHLFSFLIDPDLLFRTLRYAI
jgi:hypothetical protein